MVGKAHPTTMLDDLHEAAANALPPRREDEPASLRQEILDELSDHFACAYRRELLRTQGDAELSKRNLLARFGDPGKIARRLWFDAMKGKLMAQKLMVFATCLSAVLMALIAIVGWRYIEASQQATSALIAQSQETSAALLAQSEKTNAAILARLEAQNKEEDWGGSLEWSSFELTFVEEGTGEPVTDVTVVVRGPNENGQAADSYWQEFENLHPNASGVLELAPLHVGRYDVRIQTPWGATFLETLSVRPGHDFQKTYRVPTKPADGKVELKIQWPDRLRGRDLWCVVGAVQDSSQVVDGVKWEAVYPRFFAVHTDGRMIDLAKFYGNLDQSDSESHGPSSLIAFNESVIAARQQLGAGLSDVHEGRIAPWLLGLYTESNLPEDPDQLLYGMISLGFRQPSRELHITAASWGLNLFSTGIDLRTFSSKGDIVQGSLNRIPNPGWTRIEPGQINPWTIAYPPEAAELIPEGMLPPRTSVEAPKIPTYEDPSTVSKLPATVTIRCIDNSKNAVPIEGVSLALQRSSSGPVSWDSPPSKYELPLTNAEGVSRKGGIQPGTYNIAITTPAGALSLTDEFQIAPNQSIDRTIVCPRPWPRKPVTLSVNWPTIAKTSRDLWLVMEVTEKLVQHTDELGDWPTYGRYLFAVHPDGQIVTWAAEADASGASLFDVVNWPDNRESRFPSNMTRKHLLAWSSAISDTTQLSMFPYHSAEHRLIGVGIARWDGTGSPNEILRGLRDGRYLAGTLGGRARYSTRGAFFQIFREIVPMQSAEGLPILTIRPTGDEGIPTLFYTVPEPLVQSALNRWEELPVVNNLDENS